MQLELEFTLPSRRRRGTVQALIRQHLSHEWMDIRTLSKKTGLTRQHLHRALMADCYEIKHNGLGRGKCVEVRLREQPCSMLKKWHYYMTQGRKP